MKIYAEKDTKIERILGKEIVVFGYGSQGRAQALNARDSGAKKIRIALPDSSNSREKALADGFEVFSPLDGAKNAEIAILLTPDETHGALYQEILEKYLPFAAVIGFAHGFCLHFGQISLRPDLSSFLVAPKGPGYLLRKLYQENEGLMARIAVWPEGEKEKIQSAFETALDWASLIGCARIGLLETDFGQETESNLFGEQAILCGGAAALVRTGFEVMVENGISEEMAYLESAHSLKIIADLIYKEGLEGTNKLISKTASYGGYVGEEAYQASEMKQVMRRLMQEIKSGKFAAQFQREQAHSYPLMRQKEVLASQEKLTKIGQKIRNWLFGKGIKKEERP
ncbi:ketol-acid reductoisomerase [Acetobacteraceae bacterium]|nr:ketol-acid reductoisomerase [Acetobacteraceae bacterium]